MTKQLRENAEEIEKKKKRIIGKILFVSNLLFVDFFSKHFFSAPHGGAMFVVGNLGTFLTTFVLTALMYRYLSKKACLIAIPVTLSMALLAALC